MNNHLEKNIVIQKAKEENIQDIHTILLNAFFPYIDKYTSEAYRETVLSPQTLKKRIMDEKVVVLVAIYNNRIIGTASYQKNEKNMHLFSMAVDRPYQHKSVGKLLLNIIQEEAVNSCCRIITLDSYYPLKEAIFFYEKHGFKRTGKSRNYYGIEVFEMSKRLS